LGFNDRLASGINFGITLGGGRHICGGSLGFADMVGSI